MSSVRNQDYGDPLGGFIPLSNPSLYGGTSNSLHLANVHADPMSRPPAEPKSDENAAADEVINLNDVLPLTLKILIYYTSSYTNLYISYNILFRLLLTAGTSPLTMHGRIQVKCWCIRPDIPNGH